VGEAERRRRVKLLEIADTILRLTETPLSTPPRDAAHIFPGELIAWLDTREGEEGHGEVGATIAIADHLHGAEVGIATVVKEPSDIADIPSGRDRERGREGQRERQTERGREGQRERDRQRERETETEERET
jgi:hypothetical protein